jgi:hypothetical protein
MVEPFAESPDPVCARMRDGNRFPACITKTLKNLRDFKMIVFQCWVSKRRIDNFPTIITRTSGFITFYINKSQTHHYEIAVVNADEPGSGSLK